MYNQLLKSEKVEDFSHLPDDKLVILVGYTKSIWPHLCEKYVDSIQKYSKETAEHIRSVNKLLERDRVDIRYPTESSMARKVCFKRLAKSLTHNNGSKCGFNSQIDAVVHLKHGMWHDWCFAFVFNNQTYVPTLLDYEAMEQYQQDIDNSMSQDELIRFKALNETAADTGSDSLLLQARRVINIGQRHIYGKEMLKFIYPTLNEEDLDEIEENETSSGNRDESDISYMEQEI